TLTNLMTDYHSLANELAEAGNDVAETIRGIGDIAETTERAAQSTQRDGGSFWHRDFADVELENIIEPIRELLNQLGISATDVSNEDTPLYFPVQELPGFVEALASQATSRDLSQFVDSLNLRIRSLLSQSRLGSVAIPDSPPTLQEWIEHYLGDRDDYATITVIDLSLVPSEVIHVIVAVLSRLIFEAVQRYRRSYGNELPTVLVLEEAHTFVHKDMSAEVATPAGRLCSRMIQKISREGRKFGLGLVLSSQRPSEISPTVLSQCNTFLLHRIVNDQDQLLVKKLVPDGLGTLLNELPSLPSRRGILLGWATHSPVLVEIKELPTSYRPHSPDPAFWEVWTSDPETGVREVNWQPIVEEWTRGVAEEELEDGDNTIDVEER
ncbi:ATP-binding protein, partial [Gemmatimonadota bacterium]